MEVGEGRGVTMRKMNSLHEGSGNVLNLSSPVPSTSALLLADVIRSAAWNTDKY